MDAILPSHLLVDVTSFSSCCKAIVSETKETIYLFLHLCLALYGIYRTHAVGDLFVVSYCWAKFWYDAMGHDCIVRSLSDCCCQKCVWTPFVVQIHMEGLFYQFELSDDMPGAFLCHFCSCNFCGCHVWNVLICWNENWFWCIILNKRIWTYLSGAKK